jgi:peptidoglycan-associated lipoprotein
VDRRARAVNLLRSLEVPVRIRSLSIPLAVGTALLLVLGASGCARKAVKAPPTPATPPPTTTTTPETTPPATSTPAVPSPAVTSADLVPAFFDFDSYALRSDARAALDQDAGLLREHADVQITLEGHCDERGTVEYNLALGEKRANAARDYLVAAGVDNPRIQVVSYGKERPFEDGHDEAAWAKNRRAQVVLR